MALIGSVSGSTSISGSYVSTGSFAYVNVTSKVSGSLVSTGSFGTVHVVDRIGIGTSGPSAHLDVSGSGAQNIKIQSSDDNSGIVIASDPDEGQISFLAFAAGASYKSEILYDHDTTAASQALKFKVGDNAVTAMTILGDGNVGIGTAAPNRHVHIYRDDTSDSNCQLKIAQDGTGDATLGFILTGVAG